MKTQPRVRPGGAGPADMEALDTFASRVGYAFRHANHDRAFDGYPLLKNRVHELLHELGTALIGEPVLKQILPRRGHCELMSHPLRIAGGADHCPFEVASGATATTGKGGQRPAEASRLPLEKERRTVRPAGAHRDYIDQVIGQAQEEELRASLQMI